MIRFASVLAAALVLAVGSVAASRQRPLDSRA